MDTRLFQTQRQSKGSVEVIAASGRLTLGDPTRALRKIIEESIAEGQTRVVLDLGAVPYMDSAGLGAIASGAKLLEGAGGKLVLCNVQSRVEQLLDLTRVSSAIPSFPQEDQAIQHLAKQG